MRAEVEDGYVVVKGVRLHYREWGTAGEPPVVILHGLTGHAWEFDGVAAALAADEHHVVAVNQRGHGASAWADDYSPEIMADDAAALIEALELGRVTVIGHSMGGVNGWWLAARHPELVERIVILDIEPEAITSEKLYGGWIAALNAYARARFADSEAAVAVYLEGYAGAEREALRTFARNNIEEGSDGQWAWRFDARRLSSWLRHALDAGDEHWARLRDVACPTLIVRAANSPYTTAPAAERMAETMPRRPAGRDARLRPRRPHRSARRAPRRTAVFPEYVAQGAFAKLRRA